MSAPFVTLEYLGIEKTFEGWGFAREGASCDHVSLAPSTYNLSRPGGYLHDAPVIPFEGKVIIRRGRGGAEMAFTGGYVAFVGYRLNTLIDGRPDYAGVHYVFVNAWYFLETTPYQQSTASWSGTTLPLVDYPFTTDVTLFERIVVEGGSGGGTIVTPITNGEQIWDVLQHVLDSMDRAGSPDRHPFEIGEIDPDLPMERYPISEITCAAVIQKCLELAPDVTSHWDYSTTPPTIHFRARGNRTPVSFALANGIDSKAVRITPRYDLVPAVVIIYWRIIFSNEILSTRFQYVKEKWGPHGANSPLDPDTGPRVVVQTFNLTGATFSRLRSFVRVRTCDANTGTTADAARRAWWALHHRQFADEVAITNLTIENATFTNEITGEVFSSPPLPNELLDSVIADWIEASQVTVRVDAIAAFTVNHTPVAGGASFSHEVIAKMPISTRIVLTDATGGWYEVHASTGGDYQPLGNARKIYESLALQYEGEYLRVEQQITQQISLANTLCLSGGNAAWETMEAQIQSIREEEGTGETSIVIGPARHLSAGDLRALQLFNRLRQDRIPTAGQRATGIE